MARDEPIIVKHLNVMICAQAQPTPDKIEKNKSMPVGKAKPLIIEKIAAKINVPKLVPKFDSLDDHQFWKRLLGKAPNLEAVLNRLIMQSHSSLFPLSRLKDNVTF